MTNETSSQWIKTLSSKGDPGKIVQLHVKE